MLQLLLLVLVSACALPPAPSGHLLDGLAADECCGISCHQVWCTAQLAQTDSELTQDGKQVGVLHVADTSLPAV